MLSEGRAGRGAGNAAGRGGELTPGRASVGVRGGGAERELRPRTRTGSAGGSMQPLVTGGGGGAVAGPGGRGGWRLRVP